MDSEEEPQLPFAGTVEEIGSAEVWDSPALLAPYLPTTPEKLRAILELVEFRPGDVLFDLGCGDGRVLFEAVARGCSKAVGVDLDTELVKIIRQKADSQGLSDRITAISGDMLDIDLQEATVLYVYLLPKALTALQETVERLFQVGKLRLVLSSLFDFPSLPRTRVHHSDWDYFTYTL